jgi:hypothetical protein
VLCVVLGAAAALGLYWHFAAQTDDPDLATRPVPLTVKVYSADPAAAVDLTLTVTPQKDRTSLAQLYVTASTKKDLLLTASLPDITTPRARFAPLSAGRTGGASGQYAAVISSPAELQRLNAAAELFATFRLPVGAITHHRGTYAARLPALGQGESDALAGVVYRSDAAPTQVDAGSISPGPALTGDADGPGRTSFYVPDTLSTSESLLQARDVVANGDVEINYPGGGTLESDAFVWRGDYGVSPELTVVSRAARQRANRDAFLSGIALASAVAALIALVQELPDRWRPGRRRAAAD